MWRPRYLPPCLRQRPSSRRNTYTFFHRTRLPPHQRIIFRAYHYTCENDHQFYNNNLTVDKHPPNIPLDTDYYITNQIKYEIPQVGEIMEIIRFRKRILGRCVEVNLREDCIILEVVNESTPVAVSPRSISLRLGFCQQKDQKSPSLENIVTQARELLAQIRPLVSSITTP
jgi:hypothetical protein